MPTGYTSHIADGSETTLRQFALRAARGMGALITMRDEPWDAQIPGRFEPSDYHLKKRDEAIERLTALKAMTPEQIAEAAAGWNAGNDQRNAELVEKNEAQRKRYVRLIAETEAWEGAPEGLKPFMLDQLRQSLDFDVSEDPLKYASPRRSLEDWWGEECREAGRNAAYHSEQHSNEVQRTEERNAWLSKLHAALPA